MRSLELATHGLLGPGVGRERGALDRHDRVEVGDVGAAHAARSSQHPLGRPTGSRRASAGRAARRRRTAAGRRRTRARRACRGLPAGTSVGRRVACRASTRHVVARAQRRAADADGQAVVVECRRSRRRRTRGGGRRSTTWRRPEPPSRYQAHATASWLTTGTKGRPMPRAKVCAAAMPTRRPVNGPGPMPPTTPERSCGRMPGLGERVADEAADDLGVPHGVGGARLGEDAAVAVDDGDARARRGVDREQHAIQPTGRAREGGARPARAVAAHRDHARLVGAEELGVRGIRRPVDRRTLGPLDVDLEPGVARRRRGARRPTRPRRPSRRSRCRGRRASAALPSR